MNDAATPTAPRVARTAPWLALLVVLGGCAWLASFRGVFLFDDLDQIVAKAPRWSGEGLGLSWRQKRPLVELSFVLNYRVGGLDPFGYHAVNLAVHLLAGCALFGVVRRTLSLPRQAGRWSARAEPLAFAAALLFLVHPLQTESVTYVVQRAEALVGLFYLLTVYAFVRAVAAPRATRWYVLSVAACALGALSKEIIVTAPVVILLFDRAFVSGSLPAALRRRFSYWLALLLVTWLLFLPSGAVTGPLAGDAATSSSVGFSIQGVTPWQYALTQTEVFWRYLRLCVWPVGLVLDYGWPPVPDLAAALPTALPFVLLLALVVVLAWRAPRAGFLGLWFFGILAPTSSFVPVRDAAVEHRLYLPLAALALLAALLVDRARRALSLAPVATAWLALLPALPLALATHARNRAYASAVALWTDNVAQRPRNPRAELNLGFAFARSGDTERAREHYERALRLQPRYAHAHSNLGVLWQEAGELERARGAFERALEIDPRSVDARVNLGAVLERLGDREGAIECYRRALAGERGHLEANFNLGRLLLDAGRPAEAEEPLVRAERLAPRMARVQAELGRLHAATGDERASLEHLRRAATLAPDDLGILFALARALATSADRSLRDGAEALRLAEICARAEAGRSPEVASVLAAALAEAGRFEEAVRVQERVLAAVPAGQRAEALRRRELYAARQSYTAPP